MQRKVASRQSSQRSGLVGRTEDPPATRGITAIPPSYGLEFVDRQREHGEPPQRSASSVIQAKRDAILPADLRASIESLSGIDMSGIRVHYDSAEPARLGAVAYTERNEIRVAPGQEHHLAHEAWHAVQQRQGRVQPTTRLDGVAINDDPALESEADGMGAIALDMSRGPTAASAGSAPGTRPGSGANPGSGAVQRKVVYGDGELSQKTFVAAWRKIKAALPMKWYLEHAKNQKKTELDVQNALLKMINDQKQTWRFQPEAPESLGAFFDKLSELIAVPPETWSVESFQEAYGISDNQPVEAPVGKVKPSKAEQDPNENDQPAKPVKAPRKALDQGNVLGAFVTPTGERTTQYVIKGLTGNPIRTIYVSPDEKALLDSMYQRAAEQEAEEAYPTWGELRNDRIVNNQALVGIEVELKGMYMSVAENPVAAAAMAVAGHKPIIETQEFEIHVDAAAGSGLALLELVTKPSNLAGLKTRLATMAEKIAKKSTLISWARELAGYPEQQPANAGNPAHRSPKELMLDFVFDPKTTIRYSKNPVAVQLTTSFTEKEFAAGPMTHTVFKKGQRGKSTLLDVLALLDPKQSTAKPSTAIIKHAYEQLQEESAIPDATRVDKVPFVYQPDPEADVQKATLKTEANKLSKLLSRGQELALLVEYRGGAATTKHFISRMKEYLEGKGKSLDEVMASISDAFPHLK
jgi:hypothetical protein